MGLEGDVAIESRLVSRTIENAQTRVEGYNFDIRKRVVEYDDVINKQRETIYAERDKVLRNEDLTETVRSFIDEELEMLVDQHLAGENADEWDFDGLARAVAQLGLETDGLDPDDLAEIAVRDEVLEHLRDAVEKTIESREQEYGADVWSNVERIVLLRTIDSLWVEHLTELDDMRRGIGLRGYGGIDPLNEFKREAFKLYEELRGFIRHQVATTIFRVTIRAAPAVTQTSAAQMTATTSTSAGDGNGQGPQMASDATSSAAAILPGLAAAATRSGPIQYQHGDQPVAARSPAGGPADAPKIGRNDPCWCGSGKKFKRCHGA
jgi:preprotein translocase subunit SecA